MTSSDTVQALIAAAQDLADRAVSAPAIAERLLADANGAIAEAAGQPIPAGVVMTATRREDGTMEIAGRPDPDFQGELDDVALESVAGGATAIEYGLIAALISVAVISQAGQLGQNLQGQFNSVSAKM